MIKTMRKAIASAALCGLLFQTAVAQSPQPPIYVRPTMYIAVFETALHNTPRDGGTPLVYLKCGAQLTVLNAYRDGWLKVAVMPGQMVKVVLPDGPHFFVSRRPIIGYIKRIMTAERVRCSYRDSGVVVTPQAR